MRIFSKPGTSECIFDFTNSFQSDQGYLEVVHERPSINHELTADGRWILSDKALNEQWKADRQAKVDAIVVEIDGMTFDGDEASQSRMARAGALAESPEETIRWILADNTVAMVTAGQLLRAARAAGREQEKLWIPDGADPQGQEIQSGS